MQQSQRGDKDLIYYLFIYTLVFLYGIIIGSFLNVCIYRIPNKESVVTTRSHCMKCGHQLKWYELIPIFSFIALKGRCKACGEKISVQYPIIEGLNGILWVMTFAINGINLHSVLECLVISVLIVISVIDFRTYEIPVSCNVCIFLCGLAGIAIDISTAKEAILGFASVSLGLLLLYMISRGKVIGGGDIKLMAAAGLFLGWKLCLLAFFFGCFYGSVIHTIRMKVSGEGKVLALGPYLSMGIVSVMWFGNQILEWYLGLFS